MKYILSILALFYLMLPVEAQQVAKGEYGTFLLTNATVETVTNGRLENASVLIQDGKIAAVGDYVESPAGAKTIDCTGLTVYPGMIDGGTQLGLTEVGSISLTRDANEIGETTPHMQALTAVNPNSVAIPVTRVSGVTTVLSAPTGGRFPGTAALIDLWGYTPDQMFAGFKGVVMNFPSSGKRGWWDRRSADEIKKEEEKNTKALNDTWEAALLYAKIAKSGGDLDYNPEVEALAEVANGDATLMVNANKAKDIESALKWVAEKGVQKVILTGVYEGWRVADKIAAANIPVITGPVLRTPTRASDRYDKAYANPGIMQKAGVKVAIRTNESENVRNLPFNAGFAAAYGMGTEEALKAVTIVPAEIFGLADKLGSIEVGKQANLFIADGDPFETKTNIKEVFIKGWKIPMDSRHIRLYNEFLDRQPGTGK
jgi:imidazolonepropionase-like amidohydrolase